MLENGEACNNGGVCLFDIDTETTSCECNQKFRGENCEIECPGKHLACDGHGTCNEIGECTCDVFPIKWEGEACNCSTPVTCNGHGFCKENGECQCEFEYDPANYCLECRKHFYGSECQFTCNPNGPLPEIELLDDEPTHNQYAIGIHLDPTFAVYDGLTKKTNTMYVYRYTNNFFKLITETNTNFDQVVASANEHDLIIIGPGCSTTYFPNDDACYCSVSGLGGIDGRYAYGNATVTLAAGQLQMEFYHKNNVKTFVMVRLNVQ